MRWNAPPPRFDGALEAVPVTLQRREEDAYHPFHHRTSTAASSSSTTRRSLLPSKSAMRNEALPTTAAASLEQPQLIGRRSSLHTTPRVEPSIRISETFVPLPSKQTPRGISPRQEEPDSCSSLLPQDRAKFLVCAGRSLSSESPRSNNHVDDDDEDASPTVVASTTVRPLPLTAMATSNSGSGVASEQSALRSHRGLQRSDSELELIISELREKMVLHPPAPHQHPPSTMVVDEERSGGSGNQHSRKHLKNPLERMHMTSASVVSSSASTTGLQLRRQASATQVAATRLVSEGSIIMVTPAVLSSSASRGALSGNGGATSTSHAHPHLPPQEPMELRGGGNDDLDPAVSNETDDEGLRIRSYLTSSVGGHSHAALPHFVSSTSLGPLLSPPPSQLPSSSLGSRGSTSSGPQTTDAQLLSQLRLKQTKPKTRTLADWDLELDRLATGTGNGDATNSNNNNNNEIESLSPVGPWLAHPDGPNGGSGDEDTPLTSSLLASSPLSSSPSAPRRKPDLSPRSRLLWLSDCCSDSSWGGAASSRVMAMLRPGVQLGGRRPASAGEAHRRISKGGPSGKSGASSVAAGKPRAASAKPHAPTGARGGRKNSISTTTSSSSSQEPPVRPTSRPRSGASSTITTATITTGGSKPGPNRMTYRT